MPPRFRIIYTEEPSLKDVIKCCQEVREQTAELLAISRRLRAERMRLRAQVVVRLSQLARTGGQNTRLWNAADRVLDQAHRSQQRTS